MRLNDHPVGVSRHAVPLAGRIFIRMLERISVGCLRLVQPDGLIRSFGQRTEDTPGALHEAQLDVYDWRAATLILRQGDVGFAESFLLVLAAIFARPAFPDDVFVGQLLQKAAGRGFVFLAELLAFR